MSIVNALVALAPEASWSLDGDDYDGLTWLGPGQKPTRAEVEAAVASADTVVAWREVRAERDRLLAESDWTQTADSPLNDAAKTAWAAYRQQLRDLPQNFSNPNDVVWPIRPQ